PAGSGGSGWSPWCGACSAGGLSRAVMSSPLGSSVSWCASARAGAAPRAHLPPAPLGPLVRGVALCPERHAEVAQERPPLLVRPGGRRDPPVKPPDLVHPGVVDLRGKPLLPDAPGAIAPPL